LITAEIVQVTGVYAAYLLFLRHRGFIETLLRKRVPQVLSRLWFSGWGFDFVYDRVLVRPFFWVAHINRDDLLDLLYGGVAWYSRRLHGLLSATQTGRVRWYAAVIAFGAAVTIGIAVFL
jgi:NADH-quinone oxidoreductase subunit L